MTKPKPKPYTGPSKPLPTHVEPISDRAELIWFAVLAAVFLTLLALGLLEGGT
jgi:nitrate reductase NapE component